MSKRAEHPNINVIYYDGEPCVICECPVELCKFARFYADEPCDYCAAGQECTWPPARDAAIAATIKMLQEIKPEEEA
jgi:Zn-finger protein